jgi:hypothetical protein
MDNKNQLELNFPSSNSTNSVLKSNNPNPIKSQGKVIDLNNRANIYKKIISRTF